MTQATLSLIHKAYQQALMNSENILQVVENLYKILDEAEVSERDVQYFDNFLDGLRGCIQYRKHTHKVTNQITYINIAFMYIIHWLNCTQNMHIDINLTSRRKALESDLTKILLKATHPTDSSNSANIRDRFGLRGIVLNALPKEEAEKLVYTIYDAITGIVAGKNRKMRKEFINWYQNNEGIPESDRGVIKNILDMPFGISHIKDFIKKPKPNGYQTLQFTMTVQMYSNVLAGCQFEVQLRTIAMHENALSGDAAHEEYKTKLTEKIANVFTVDDFSTLHIVGFTGIDTKEHDSDGFHYAKIFSDRRISETLVT